MDDKDKKIMSDHDSLITLIANVENLTKSQERFHVEVKEAFKELSENYSGKITAQNVRIDAQEVRLNCLEAARITLQTTTVIAGVVAAAMSSMLIWHLFQTPIN